MLRRSSQDEAKQRPDHRAERRSRPTSGRSRSRRRRTTPSRGRPRRRSRPRSSSIARFQETSTVSSARDRRTTAGSPPRGRASGPGSRPAPAGAARRGSGRAGRAETAKLTALSQYARSGPAAATTIPPSERADRDRQLVGGAQQRVRARQHLRRRRGSAARRRRPDARSRWRRRRASASATICPGLTANASSTKTASRIEVGADEQALAREPVDERAEQQPDRDRRAGSRRSAAR